MNESSSYTPPKTWKWDKEIGGRFAKINRPVAGATHEKELPVGRHCLQLYSLATPNGVKVTIMLEELLALGHDDAEYDAWPIRITEGDQFGSGFVAVNPNSKIPALVDRGGPTPIRVFESGSILLYLPRSSERSYRPTRRFALNACRGCSGGWGRALPWWRVWPFLRLRTDQDRVRDRSFCDGGEAPTRCSGSAGCAPLSTWQAPTIQSPIEQSGLGTARLRRVCSTRRVNSYKSRTM